MEEKKSSVSESSLIFFPGKKRSSSIICMSLEFNELASFSSVVDTIYLECSTRLHDPCNLFKELIPLRYDQISLGYFTSKRPTIYKPCSRERPELSF